MQTNLGKDFEKAEIYIIIDKFKLIFAYSQIFFKKK